MIVSKTPLRMSFVGGGSDLPAYYREEIGAVLSTSINKYMYICINRKFDGRIRLNYSVTEEVDSNTQIKHPLARHALQLVGIDGGVEIASMADIPSKGTGLGSSSAYTVGLLNALYAYQNQFATKETLACEACMIEIDRCKEPIGKQDQYAVAFGGLNLISFHPDESVTVDPVICKPNLIKDLENSILVFFTGRTRSASSILAHQSEIMKEKSFRKIMRRMVGLAIEMKSELEKGSLENIGELLNENWKIKTQLAKGITDDEIDDWYKKGIANGAMGGKLLGAGNGGFLMFCAPKENHERIKNALNNLTPINFKFDNNGSKIIYYQPNL
jgi:D-glycero-alpha-D-manno-heptose-7-phosphate kinase